MARPSATQTAAALRAHTYRITSCPPQQLPAIAAQIAASLWNCRAAFGTFGDQTKTNTEVTQTVSRFRSSLSQLLQARTVEERWAAVVLTKAAVEAGGADAISKAAGWTKSLVAILKKNDPPATQVLSVITLTRIFTLTWHDTNLVREITTPSLPGFVQACLTAGGRAEAPPTLVLTVLEAFATLIPRHPTIFRTCENQIRTLLLAILSSTASNAQTGFHYGATHRQAAARLYVLLHHSAPKQGGPERWQETLAAVVDASHSTCDLIFRSITEDRKTSVTTDRARASAGALELQGSDAVGLASWAGMHAGAERLVALLDILRAHIRCATSGTTSTRLGIVFDLLQRLLDLDTSLRDDSARFNPQVARDEREQLLQELPSVHAATISLLDTVIQRFGTVIAPAVRISLGTVCNAFGAEDSYDRIRAATYRLIRCYLQNFGPSLTKDDLAVEISPIISACCEDLLPYRLIVNHRPDSSLHQAQTNSATAKQISAASPAQNPSTSDAFNAAWTLLPIFFTNLDQSLLPRKSRTRLEQTAILVKHKHAMVASVLNPTQKSSGTAPQPSLLPLLAREYPESAEMEALLRPRMPIVNGDTEGLNRTNGDWQSEDDSLPDDENDDHESVADMLAQDGLEGAQQAVPGPGAVDASTAIDSNNPRATSPERRENGASAHRTSKRSAIEGLEPVSMKRPRTSPDMPAPAMNSSRLPNQSVPGQSEGSEILSAADAEDSSHAFAAAGAAEREPAKVQAKDEASDDSDFDIPPLTMESDSEAEE